MRKLSKLQELNQNFEKIIETYDFNVSFQVALARSKMIGQGLFAKAVEVILLETLQEKFTDLPAEELTAEVISKTNKLLKETTLSNG